MIPRRIQNSTHRLGAPPDWATQTGDNCVALHARRVTEDGLVIFESAWEPTPAEIEAINAGGSIVLRVVGGQPPVALYVESPTPEPKP
jgi:hypothetical protein